jgi:hypothetical protein
MTGPYSLRLRASRLDGGAPTYYPSSPLTKQRQTGREKKDWSLLASLPPSPPCHISPWKTAPTPVPAGIGQLSSPLPFPPSSRAPAAGISTGCSAGGDAPVFGPPFPRTTSTCRPLGVRIVLGKLRWAHARMPVLLWGWIELLVVYQRTLYSI